MLVAEYALERIDFRPWARSVLSAERLEDLHLRADPQPFANYVERMRYYAGLLCDNFASVVSQYRELVDLIAPQFGGVMLRQGVPSIRCHLAGAGTASSMHRDGDPKYGITPGVINCWVPLTKTEGNNSLHIESAPGLADCRPISLAPGQLLIFDAFNLLHGSYPNDTQSTRISFDFRFLPNEPARARELKIVAAGQGTERSSE
jgi:hypothetical protein